jgi:internalin A
MNKPESILQLEKHYHIEIPEKEDSDMSSSLKNYYRVNTGNEVIELVLDDCKISSIMYFLAFSKLEKLSLANNRIKEIGALKTLTKIRFLDVQNNIIEDIISLKELRELSHLNIAGNKVRDLSPVYNQLKSGVLEYMNADFNDTVYPPTKIALSHNSEIVEWFETTWQFAREKINENLNQQDEHLDLGRCGITDLSFFPELYRCVHLKRLTLSNEWAEYIDGDWQRITSSNKGLQNNIFHIPTDIISLQNLEVLICGGDWRSKKEKAIWNRWRIKSFALFTKLRNLTYLNLSNNKIRSVSSLGKLQRLKEIHLNNNEIMSFDNNVMLFELEEIYLSNNSLRDITFLNTFPSIKTIDLHANYIKDLTPIRKIIEGLDIHDTKWGKDTISIAKNKLIHPTIQVINRGKVNVLAYFDLYNAEQIAQLKPFKNTDIKIILVGNSSSGKSTLAHWLKNGAVDLNLPSTHWMDVVPWRVKDKAKNLSARIFDFGGQEYYHDTHHLFFTRQTVYVLLWDKETNNFDEIEIEQKQPDGVIKKVKIQGYPLSYWLDSIDYYTNKRTILKDEAQINKLLDERDEDVSSSIKIGDDWTKHVIDSTSKIQNLVDEPPNILIMQSKADTVSDIRYVDQIALREKHNRIYEFFNFSLKTERRLSHFKELLFELLRLTPILDRELLGTWGAIKQKIENQNESYTKEISLVQFRKFCNDTIQALPELQNISKGQMDALFFDDTDTKSFAQYLNDIGILLYFPEDGLLQDKVFINQKHVLEKIYKILFGLEQRNGEFSKADIAFSLKKASFDDECETIMDLMVHFKIIIAHPSLTDAFIAPLYLPKTPMKSVQIFLSAFKKPIYRFLFTGYIHKNVILEFFHIYGSKALKETGDNALYYYWREGIVLKDEETKEILMVKFVNGNPLNEEAYIDIYCLHHSSNELFLNKVIEELEKINSDRKVIKSVTLNGEDFVPVAQLHDAEVKGNWVFQYKDKYYNLPDFKNHLKNKLKMKKVFISYSKADAFYLTKLENHLSVLKRNGTISTWNCRELLAGDKWDGKIKKELEEADIIIFLVSDDFLATDYIYDIEIKRAIEREETDPNVRVIPVILRSCYWEESPLAAYNTAPKKAQVVTLAKDIDESFKNIVLEIKKTL